MMLRHLRGDDQGAAIVEFALILPILILLVFGTIEFGRAYNAKVTLTHAAREGVRELAINRDPVAAEDAAVFAASSTLQASNITVTQTFCNPGEPVELVVGYPLQYDIPLFGSGTLNLTSKGVMRCGG